jgi:replicative DNA helicase
MDTNNVNLGKAFAKTFQYLAETKSHSKGVTGLPTGFKLLDEMTSGLQKSNLIVIAGRPSTGKTSLVLNIATTVIESDRGVVFFSLEMTIEQLGIRFLSAKSTTSLQRIRSGTMTSDDWVELTNIATELRDLKLIFASQVFIIEDLIKEIKKLKEKNGLQLVVIDYLQLLQSSKQCESRHAEISEIMRALKILALELEICIIVTSDISRNADLRSDHRPILIDLPESSSIEREADLVMFLYRDVLYNPDTENPYLAELIVAKQRNGPTGTVFMNFLREIIKFEDAE